MTLKKSSFSSLSLSTMNDSKLEESSTTQRSPPPPPQSSLGTARIRQQQQQQQEQEENVRAKQPPGLIALHRPIFFGFSDDNSSDNNNSRWYYHARNMIQGHLKEFMAKANVTAASARRNTNSFPTATTTLPSFPAVDLASGSGLFAVAMAQHFQRPKFTIDFKWYPTESAGMNTDSHDVGNPPNNTPQNKNKLQEELRSTLQFLGKHPLPLFGDRNGKAVYRGDSIRLHNLQTAKYNHIHGVVVGRDPNSPQRYGIQLGSSQHFQRCSIQSTNIVRDGNSMGEGILVDTTTATSITNSTTSSSPEDNSDNDSKMKTSMVGDGNHQSFRYEKACQEDVGYERKEFFQGLLQRSCEVNILQPSTWSNLPLEIQQKCVLVTCTHFLGTTTASYPNAWKHCLKLASQLLIVGGLFLTYDDSSGHNNGYGNVEVMVEYIHLESLCLVPVETRRFSNIENIHQGGGGDNPNTTSPMTMMIWRKVDDKSFNTSSSTEEEEKEAMQVVVLEENSTTSNTGEILSIPSPTQ